ncbi:MAG: extracellular matrix biosynthesis-like protein [Paenibacillaceae bacterium]|nr:extracellular matrix biosynthesis-like protein [Paenibacillaceae bacterium]
MEARARGIATVVAPYSNFYEMYAPGPYFHSSLQTFVQENRNELGNLICVLKDQHPDVVINSTCVNVLPALAAQAMGIPVGWMITEQIMNNPHTHMAIEVIDQYSDWIIGISNATLQPFRGGTPESKTLILYPSWNESELEREMWPYYRYEKRAEMGCSELHRVVGYVTSDIYANKGLEHFIHMAVELAETNPDLRFMVAGKPTDQAYYNKCLQLIQSTGYESRFYVNPFEMRIQKIYPAIDLLVIPSLIEEGFGMTALEGLIFGKAVITYTSGGLSEIMQQTGNAAYLVEKGNVPALTGAASLLLSKGDWVRGWGIHNAVAVREVFGIESYRARLSEWLSQMGGMIPQLRPLQLPIQAIPGRTVLFVQGAGPAVYLLAEGYKYLFPNAHVFAHWGGTYERVIPVDQVYLGLIPDGGVLSLGVPAVPPPPPVRARRGKGKKGARRLRRWKKGASLKLRASRRSKLPAGRGKKLRRNPGRKTARLGKKRVARSTRIRSRSRTRSRSALSRKGRKHKKGG